MVRYKEREADGKPMGKIADTLDMDVELSQMTADDLPHVLGIANDAIEHGELAWSPESVSAPEFATELALDYEPFGALVARSASAVVGVMALTSFYRREAYDRTAKLTIFVDRKWRQRGLAGRLLVAATERAENTGFRNLVAVTFDQPQWLVERCEAVGFRLQGTLRVSDAPGSCQRRVVLWQRML